MANDPYRSTRGTKSRQGKARIIGHKQASTQSSPAGIRKSIRAQLREDVSQHAVAAMAVAEENAMLEGKPDRAASLGGGMCLHPPAAGIGSQKRRWFDISG